MAWLWRVGPSDGNGSVFCSVRLVFASSSGCGESDRLMEMGRYFEVPAISAHHVLVVASLTV
jgi:hypothetical protein